MGLYCLYMGRCKSNERVVAYHPDGRLFRIYESAIKAALNPADTDYIYFFADVTTGKVYFTNSSAEFENFKRLYR